MIRLITIDKLDPDTYVAVIDKHGDELRFEVRVKRGEDIILFPYPPGIEDEFREYALDSPPGRSRGALVIPIVQKVMKVIREIDKGIEHDFPIVLHPDE